MKRLLIIPLLVFALNAYAGPIGVERATELAAKFFNKNATRATAATVELEWAGNNFDGTATRAADVDEALLYVFNRTDDKGFVVLSGEDSYDHVIAFSHENGFDTMDMPESARYILSSMCDEIAQARLSAPESTRAENLEYDLGVGNVVVDHKAAKWNQGEPYNRECPWWEGDWRRSITGCVATGMAIVMRHYQWPEYGTGLIPSYGEGKYYLAPHQLGPERKYLWKMMPLEYISGQYTNAQGDAVATLMYDCGRSLPMAYGANGSGSHTGRMPYAFTTYYKYAPSVVYMNAWKMENGKYYPGDFTYEEWIEAVERNLTTFGPMNISLSGHSVVYDGFTDKHYIKINHGWGGSADGFFYLPDHWHSDGGWYYPFTAAVFYLQPLNKEGVSTSLFQVKMSGTNSGIEAREVECFKQNEPFTLTLGQVQNISTQFNGDIAVVLCDRAGKVVETLAVNEGTSIAPNGLYYPNKELTITHAIQPGYRIRVYYKDKDATEWKWARREKLRVVDEIVVCASPEDIAKMTSLHYVPDTKKLSLRTLLALGYEIRNEAGDVVASGVKKGAGGRLIKDGQYYDSEVVFDLSKFAKGNYTVSLTCGNDPYTFVLTI